jgi:ABC-type molybdate transport system ATPase subunit
MARCVSSIWKLSSKRRFPGIDLRLEQDLPFSCEVRLERLVQRLGGLDASHEWDKTLSLEEQQRIAFARLLLTKPDFAFLDHAGSALSEAEGDARRRRGSLGSTQRMGPASV